MIFHLKVFDRKRVWPLYAYINDNTLILFETFFVCLALTCLTGGKVKRLRSSEKNLKKLNFRKKIG
jgi:hypothetical protein